MRKAEHGTKPHLKAKAKEPARLLTPVELEIMSLLWRLGEGTVSDVLGALPKERKLAYTSVSTVMRILEGKKVVAPRKEGRGHVYVPLVTKESYERASLHHLVSHVFGGAPVTLVRRLLDADCLTHAELDSLKALVSEKLEKAEKLGP